MEHDNKILEDRNFKRLFPNKKVVNLKGEFKTKPFGEVFVFNSVSKWLDGIRNSEYIVTDSYHGLIFSIIFNKKIILIGKKSTSISRFETIFENLKGGIEKINYGSLDEVKDIDILLDYNVINHNIERLKSKSIKFLTRQLFCYIFLLYL
jgi:exopolysaccharide biosynthesis predicted pyruvyltransferase EpsI